MEQEAPLTRLQAQLMKLDSHCLSPPLPAESTSPQRPQQPLSVLPSQNSQQAKLTSQQQSQRIFSDT
jgi:hypothetical protein